MTRRKKKEAAPEESPLATPLQRAGFRDPEYVQSVVLRMGTGYVDALDSLCKVNARSRRVVVETLIETALADYVLDPETRIIPL